jgi:hypothetical protein
MAEQKKETTELMTKSAAGLPAFVKKEEKLDGFEQLNIETMAIPFIKVLNALSPELNHKKEEFIAGAKIGDIVNSVTRKKYGTEIELVVIKFEHMFVEWKPNRGGFAGYHTPLEANEIAVDKTFGKWKTKDGNDLTETYMYYVLIVGHENDGVCIISADSADLKNAKRLNTMMQTQRYGDGSRAYPHCQVYLAKSTEHSNDKGDWNALVYTFSDFVDEKLYNIAMYEREQINTKTVDFSQMDTVIPEDSKKANIPY